MHRIALLRPSLARPSNPLRPLLLTRIPPTAPLAGPRITIVPTFFRSFYASRSRLTPLLPPITPTEQQTLSVRLKTLIKTYGWYALGLHMIFSALDFGVAFAAVNFLGVERVTHVAATAKRSFHILTGHTPTTNPEISPQPQAGGSEGLYAILVLAFAIHKTLFFPVRVSLTAVVTPRFVGWLAHRGWTGGDGAKKAIQAMRAMIRRRSPN